MVESSFMDFILGSFTPEEMAASMFFAILTATGMLLTRIKRRDKDSLRTPNEWSWKFFLADTAPYMIGTFILIFLCIRFAQQWLKPEWVMIISAGIGLISDQLATLLTKAHDKATEIISHKIDAVGDKVEKVDIKIENVDTKVDDVSTRVNEKLDELKGSLDEVKKTM